MASPLILTLLAKHHLVERDPIGSPDFLHHEGRQDVDFDSVCVKKSPPPGFFSSTRRNFPQNVFISWFVVACRSSTYLGLLNCNIKMISTLIFVSLSLCLSESCFKQVLAEAHCVSRLGHFRITFGLIFKASPVVHPFI